MTMARTGGTCTRPDTAGLPYPNCFSAGSPECRENTFAVQTLKDFGKDQGFDMRENSKQLVVLLKDEEQLKTERVEALKTKERMTQVATGVGSNQITFGRGSSQPNLSTSYSEQEYGKAGGSPAF